ncbi:RagB/SusD family nutrient uptake outer membrane protein [Aquimarina sp. RZ0]|uniref:RagB/SusD family nutrient uptake outer membrane protein n=1 Tax=Aquimarina sp. RZ0 TaxID=2607730 RepID=UPI0011F18C8B|nr:RagB/SusD family nutrient uptake outer membrane protein [Aquimarina sp. RZ0]KAA1246617.1 RagB/SusD family nutrient uptake outer membrane protein [Aquimarina sp. RZ0]
MKIEITKQKRNWQTCIYIALLIIFPGACADLDEDPGAVQISPETLTTVGTLRAIVTGMYQQLANEAQWSDFFLASYGGDDVTTFSGGNKQGYRDADWRSQTSFSDRIERTYLGCYRVITSANTAINARENITVNETNKDEFERLIGESHFMRAFCYLKLTRTYGEIPIQLKTNNLEPLTRASFEQIYMQIEADLREAERLLPDEYPGIETVGIRPSKGAAKALLARLYMHWAGFPLNDPSRYTMAATEAKEIIDGNFGYELNPSLRELWTISKRFEQKESIFMLVFCNDGCAPNNRTTGRLGLPGDASGWSETFGEITFFEDMEEAANNEGTSTRFEDTYVLEVIPRGMEPDGADWRNFQNEPHPLLRKVISGDLTEDIFGSTRNGINRYFMRYADLLLIYAEASGRSGNITPEAWEALNQVRRRAAGKDPNTPDPSIDIVTGDLGELAFTERKWELAGEYERWHDIVRMDRIAEVFAQRSPDEVSDIINNKTPSADGKYAYFTPIPQREIDNSPQLAD